MKDRRPSIRRQPTDTESEDTPLSLHLDLKARFSYELDNRLARGALPAILLLSTGALLLVLVAALVFALLEVSSSSSNGVGEGAWVAMTRALDPGTMADDVGWRLRVLSLLVTLVGVFILSSLIGLITNGIDRRLNEFRRGRTPVVERNHVLVLGWSPKVPSIIQEQINARSHNKERTVVAVLAPRDKLEMEQEVYREISIPQRVRLVFRSGLPSNPRDLALMNPEHARSVLVLSPRDDSSPDAQVVRACFALLRSDRTPRPVIAEIRSSSNAEGIRDASGGDVIPVVSSEVIAKIAAQIMRYPGLSEAYERVLDFAGDEFYVAEVPELVGSTYEDAVLAFDSSSVVGLYRPDPDPAVPALEADTARSPVMLCPALDEVIGPSDRLIAVSRNAASVVPDAGSWRSQVEPDPSRQHEKGHRIHERLLIVGWSPVAPMLLEVFNAYLVPGSSASVIAVPELSGNIDTQAVTGHENLSVTVEHHCDGDFAPIDALLLSQRFDRIILLSYRIGVADADADARTLLTLVHIRRFLSQNERLANIPVLAELQNASDTDLVGGLETEDFIVSDRLAGQMLSQLSVTPELSEVFRELFEPWGADILLRPVTDYISVAEARSYGDLVAAGLTYGEAVIGYLSRGGGRLRVELNPRKASTAQFTASDEAIVVVRR